MSKKHITGKTVPSDPTDGFDYLDDARAATEMTGLIPSGRPDHTERESYEDLLPYPPPVLKQDPDHTT